MVEMNLKIDSEKCVHCGQCIKDCMACALEFDENKIPKVALGGENRCIKCQHCLAVCPTGALSIFDKNPEDSEIKKICNPDEVLNLIKNRRSYRHFKQENISPEIMYKLKDMLNWVPTGVNDHRLHFSFIDDIEVMNDFRNYTNKKIIEFASKPVLNVMFKKFERYKKALLRGDDIIFRGAPHMVVVSSPINAHCKDVDPMIALSYFELYAQSLGIGTCWCGLAYGVLRIMPELCKQLEIPNTHKMSYAMLFGLPDVNYKRATQPESCEFVSVKLENRDMNFKEKLIRFLINSL